MDCLNRNRAWAWDWDWYWFVFRLFDHRPIHRSYLLRFPPPKIVILMTLTTSDVAQTRILFAQLPVC